MSAPLFVVGSRPAPSDLITDWEVWQYAQSLSARTVTERSNVVTRCAHETGTGPDSVPGSGGLRIWRGSRVVINESW